MRKEVIVSPEDTDDAKDMWSYGTGSYSVPEHDFVQINPNYVKRPFDNADGLLVWKKKDIGWVNFNSDRKRVYAIRIEQGTTHEDGTAVSGTSPQGSPAPESKVVIYVEGIRTALRNSAKRNQLALTDTQLQDAVDVVIGGTISHEIGHSLNLDHCHDETCLMYQDDEDERDNKHYKWDPIGKKLVHKRSGFKRHQLNEHYYAVTGASITKTQKSYISIEFVLDEVGTVPSPSPSSTMTYSLT